MELFDLWGFNFNRVWGMDFFFLVMDLFLMEGMVWYMRMCWKDNLVQVIVEMYCCWVLNVEQDQINVPEERLDFKLYSSQLKIKKRDEFEDNL